MGRSTLHRVNRWRMRILTYEWSPRTISELSSLLCGYESSPTYRSSEAKSSRINIDISLSLRWYSYLSTNKCLVEGVCLLLLIGFQTTHENRMRGTHSFHQDLQRILKAKSQSDRTCRRQRRLTRYWAPTVKRFRASFSAAVRRCGWAKRFHEKRCSMWIEEPLNLTTLLLLIVPSDGFPWKSSRIRSSSLSLNMSTTLSDKVSRFFSRKPNAQ